MRRTPVFTGHLALSLSALLLAAACGGGDNSTENTEGAGGATGGQSGAAGKGGASGKGGQAGSSGSSGQATGGGGGGGTAGGAAGGAAGGTAGGAAGVQAGGASGAGAGGGVSGSSGQSGSAGDAGGSSGGATTGGSGGSGGGAAGAAGDASTGGGGQGPGGTGNSCESGEDCNGTCVDTKTSVEHCGSCEKVCDSTNGTAACVNGTCAIQCADGFADCDGKADNGCEVTGSCACKPGESASCYTGPAGTEAVGACKAGTHTCNAQGTGFDECQGQVLPQAESCLTSVDDDCDGKVNEEGEGCACVPGSTSPCYGGPAGTEGVGPCKGGIQTCKGDGTGYGACEGQVLPQNESCLTPLVDDDCDGQLNESGQGCLCVPGTKISCYDGAPGTSGVGVCHGGQRTCKGDGTGYGDCEGQVVPTSEVCDGTLGDENCDGQVNEGGAGCACVPGDATGCYSGPAATKDVGLCKAGFQFCTDAGTGYGPCQGEVTPQAERCDGTTNDEDCDGQVNENGVGCVCAPGTTSPCYDGEQGTQGVGACKAGAHTCNAQGTGYGACTGQVLPQKDICNDAVDNDCNGATVACGATQECNTQTGDCVDACDPALLGSSYQGCVYYPTVTANLVNHTNFSFAIAISNTSSKPASVTVTRGATTVTTVTVAANSVQIVKLPWDLTLKGPTSLFATPFPASVRVNQGAYKVTSTRPVTVYQYNPLEYTIGGDCQSDQSRCSFSNDASLLLPVNAWTGNYRVMARHHWANSSGFMAVVASQDGTVVTLAAGPQSGQIKSGITGIGTNGAGTVTLNAGDVIELVTNGGASQSDPNDPTGMLVTASKPVQVIGGHQCINVPDTTGYCDHLEESMFPLETLAKEYLITSPLISAGVPKGQVVRVLATKPNTTLSYDPAQPGAPTSIAAAGGWVELAQTSNNFKITASEPILVNQYMLGQDAGGNSGDPAMALAVTTAQYRTNYLFHAPTNYSSNFVNITAPSGVTVVLDGAAVPAASFTTIGGSGYSVARVQLPNTNSGNHTITSAQPSGISVYGYGQYTSYWYPGGLDLKPISN